MLSLKAASRNDIISSRSSQAAVRCYSIVPDLQISTARAPAAQFGSPQKLTLGHGSRKYTSGSNCNKCHGDVVKNRRNMPNNKTATPRASTGSVALFKHNNNNKDNSCNDISKNNNSFSGNDYVRINNNSVNENTTTSYVILLGDQTTSSRAPTAAADSSRALTLKLMPADNEIYQRALTESRFSETVARPKVSGFTNGTGIINIALEHRGFKGSPILKSQGSSKAVNKIGLVVGKSAWNNAQNFSSSTCSLQQGCHLQTNPVDRKSLCGANVKHVPRARTTATAREHSSTLAARGPFAHPSWSQGTECLVSKAGYTTHWTQINNEDTSCTEAKKTATVVASREMIDLHQIGVPKTGCIQLTKMPFGHSDLSFTLHGRNKRKANPNGLLKPVLQRHPHQGILIRNKAVLRLINSIDKGILAELREPEMKQHGVVSEFSTTIGGLLHFQMPKVLSLGNRMRMFPGVYVGGSKAYHINREKSGLFLQHIVQQEL